ncbi:Cilia- and flagella-associated protein 36 [Orchesella cincta]|uniref:Cilia- and flagella-associated protein 36 n=1 Tax=Orchesella cincta TaxID=48709 RepID=A0A1D2NBI0_ORCCI|nr:Cilia- and flagella-associated protein 36 [Orchesella cincta]
MSESDIQPAENVDNWVFDSLVNFLHGSIWKVPVVGFIEEKSVVFDPDSYNNMTEEKEEEFRKIHEEYKGVVDFMLSSFMEDLQVTPEQVEEACRVREHQSKSLPESHITKVALEQLWAAEDFTSFRRLMTRKNIDLQLQSLELLVAKYGVLSPSLRSGDSEEATEDGEEDFLQVVIRYSDQLELFKCDYGTEEPNPGNSGKNGAKSNSHTTTQHNSNGDDKNMKLHLAGIHFKNVAPTPANYQATLSSTSTTKSSTSTSEQDKHTIPPSGDNIHTSNLDLSCKEDDTAVSESPNPDVISQNTSLISNIDTTPNPNVTNKEDDNCLAKPADVDSDLSKTNEADNIQPEPTKSTESNVQLESSKNLESALQIESPKSPEVHVQNEPAKSIQSETKLEVSTNLNENVTIEPDKEIDEKNNSPTDSQLQAEPESQLIQLEEAEAAMEEESILKSIPEGATGMDELKSNSEEPRRPRPDQERLDEQTAVEIASTAPEQRRLLTAVRKALETNQDDSEPAAASIDIPTGEKDEDIQKRREYLRAQRDKLVAMKKQEREKLLEKSEGQHSTRPKSARAAQMAIKNPVNMRALSISEKSLSARRALADRLKQELIEK